MEALYNLGVIFSVIDKFTGPVRKMAESLSNLEQQAQKARAMIDLGNKMGISGALMTAGAHQVKNALGSLLAPAADTQRALGELASIGVEDLDALSKAAMDFSKRWAGTTEAEFLTAAYSIKSGIASLSDAAVGEFTAMAALTAKATKSTADEMTSLFATSYGIYKDMYSDVSDFQFAEMFSAGLATSVRMFKTSGSGMSQALQRLGAAATTAQRPMEEQLAVLGMLQATMPGAEAGTKYKAFVSTAAKAGEALGMSFVDSSGQLLGMAEILDLLRARYGDNLDAMQKMEIAKAFGTQEAVSLIDLLYGKVGDLRDNIDAVGMSMAQGKTITEAMAEAMNRDVGAALELLGQNTDITKRIIGEELGGLLVAIIPSIQAGIQALQEWAEANPMLVRVALLLAVAGGAALGLAGMFALATAGMMFLVGYFRLGVVSIIRGISQVKGGLSWLLRFGWSTFRILGTGVWFLAGRILALAVTALPPAIAGAWAFAAALLANPLTWIVLGIMALIAALVLLWRNWDTVREYVSSILNSMVEGAREQLGAIRDSVAGAIENAIQWVRSKYDEWRESGMALIDAFTGGIRSMINKPAEVVKSGLQKLRNLLPFSDAKEGPLSTLSRSGMALIETFAAGIRQRAPLLRSTTSAALAGAGLSGGLGYKYNGPGLGSLLSSVTRERETHVRDRRPIVVVLGDAKPPENLDSIIDQAYRYLSMSGE